MDENPYEPPKSCEQIEEPQSGMIVDRVVLAFFAVLCAAFAVLAVVDSWA